MSTGVLRGHEGSPLVIGDTMYVHTPFPNNVFAVNLKDQSFKWKYEPKQDADVIPVMCCDTVNRGLAYGDGKIFLQQADTTLVALDANTGKVVWSAKNGDPKIGETNTNAPHVFKDKVITGISGGEFGVRGRLIAYDIKTGKKVWTAYSTGPDNEMLVDPQKTMTWTNGKMAPVGKDSSLKIVEGRPVEDRRRHDLGLVFLRSEAEPRLLRHRQSGHLESCATSGRQQVVDDDLRARSRHRHGEVGLPDDAARRVGLRRRQRESCSSTSTSRARKCPALVHFDRNGFGYTLNRETGELLVAEKYDPKVNWATQGRHEDRPSDRRQEVLAAARRVRTST